MRENTVVLIEPMLTSHIDQFGFVEKSGCNEAYFVQRKSNVYFCGLDVAKAFDSINQFY